MCYNCFKEMESVPSLLDRVTQRAIYVDAVLNAAERMLDKAVRGEVVMYMRTTKFGHPERVDQEHMIAGVMELHKSALKRRNRLFLFLEDLVDLGELTTPSNGEAG